MKIVNSDCLEYLKQMPDNSVDAIVTDPPYGLSFMGKKWDYDVPSQEIWEECLRVLKPGGYLLSFAGTRTQHRMAVRIEDAGFEIRDMIAWVYGSGFPKSLNIGKAVDKLQGNEREVVGTVRGVRGADGTGHENAMPGKATGVKQVSIDLPLTKGTSEWEGWGTALKPALEPITVARKPIEGNVAQNCLKWGVGGINIDGCRVEGVKGVPASTRTHFSGNSVSMPNDDHTTKGWDANAGRFPANLIHDGSDEVVEGFPITKGPWGKKKSTAHTAMFNAPMERELDNSQWQSDGESAARFFYCAKSSRRERNMGCEELGGNKHCTVKPIALMEYLVKLVSKEGHTVLDPFMGSGSTGIACKKLGREFIGIEKEADYCKIAEARIAVVQPVQEELL